MNRHNDSSGRCSRAAFGGGQCLYEAALPSPLLQTVFIIIHTVPAVKHSLTLGVLSRQARKGCVPCCRRVDASYRATIPASWTRTAACTAHSPGVLDAGPLRLRPGSPAGGPPLISCWTRAVSSLSATRSPSASSHSSRTCAKHTSARDPPVSCLIRDVAKESAAEGVVLEYSMPARAAHRSGRASLTRSILGDDQRLAVVCLDLPVVDLVALHRHPAHAAAGLAQCGG